MGVITYGWIVVEHNTPQHQKVKVGDKGPQNCSTTPLFSLWLGKTTLSLSHFHFSSFLFISHLSPLPSPGTKTTPWILKLSSSMWRPFKHFEAITSGFKLFISQGTLFGFLFLFSLSSNWVFLVSKTLR